MILRAVEIVILVLLLIAMAALLTYTYSWIFVLYVPQCSPLVRLLLSLLIAAVPVTLLIWEMRGTTR